MEVNMPPRWGFSSFGIGGYNYVAPPELKNASSAAVPYSGCSIPRSFQTGSYSLMPQCEAGWISFQDFGEHRQANPTPHADTARCPQNLLHDRQQSVRGVGLQQYGGELKPMIPVQFLDATRFRSHDHRQWHAREANFLYQFQAGEPRQAVVSDEQIVIVGMKILPAGFAVCGRVHLIAGTIEHLRAQSADSGVGSDQKNAVGRIRRPVTRSVGRFLVGRFNELALSRRRIGGR